MSSTTHPEFSETKLRERLDRYFAAFGQGFNAYLERRSRQDQIHRLEAMTDDQLARLGIRRDRIEHHVFRDVFYI